MSAGTPDTRDVIKIRPPLLRGAGVLQDARVPDLKRGRYCNRDPRLLISDNVGDYHSAGPEEYKEEDPDKFCKVLLHARYSGTFFGFGFLAVEWHLLLIFIPVSGYQPQESGLPERNNAYLFFVPAEIFCYRCGT